MTPGKRATWNLHQPDRGGELRLHVGLGTSVGPRGLALMDRSGLIEETTHECQLQEVTAPLPPQAGKSADLLDRPIAAV